MSSRFEVGDLVFVSTTDSYHISNVYMIQRVYHGAGEVSIKHLLDRFKYGSRYSEKMFSKLGEVTATPLIP